MERIESNPTALPFVTGAAVISVVLCVGAGYTGWTVAGMLIVWFCAAFAGLLLLFVAALSLVALFTDTREPQKTPHPFYGAFITYVEGLLPALFRVRIHVSGKDALPEGRWLLVGNHRSAFDPLVTGWVLRDRPFVFIAKPSIRRIPVVGTFFHKAGYQAIDRENDRAALKTILEAARLIREGIASVGIYPEGTRSRDEALLPFRNGAFKIAQKAKAPIAVAFIRGTEKVRKNFPWRATDVFLEFRAVIDPAAVAGMNTTEIGEEVRKCMNFANC